MKQSKFYKNFKNKYHFSKISHIFNQIYQFWYNFFPIFTWKMNMNTEEDIESYPIQNLIFKSFEILVNVLYFIDVIPKLFLWKRNLFWKILNTVVVTLMAIQLPIFMKGQVESYGQVREQSELRVRMVSVGLGFLLLCEILSLREQRTLRLKKIQELVVDRRKEVRKLAQSQNIFGSNEVKKSEEDLRYYSWCEIIKHDKPNDCWIVIHGFVYDVTNLLNIHPGGTMILDGAGGECTFMWHSYHPTYLTDNGVPEKYLIGKVRDYEDFYSYDGDFYRQIKKKVEKILPKDQRRHDYKLYFKSLVVVIGYFYFLHMFVTENTIISAIILGFFAGQVGVNIMHDGNHIAYSNSKTVSYLMGFTLDMIFSCAIVYRRSHNYGHHGCVNHYELDRAFDTTYPVIRLHKMQTRQPYHKYQHIYTWFVYLFTTIADFSGTFDELYWMSNYPTRRGYVSKFDLIEQIIVKISFFYILLYLPALKFGFAAAFLMFIFFLFNFSYGYAIYFAVNHWTLESDFIDNKNINQTNWGVLQVQNSSNYALDSQFWTNISGGLNYQIEHHLFPGLAHTRLPQISQIIQDHCKEYNARYFSFKTFWSALHSHYLLLKQNGQED